MKTPQLLKVFTVSTFTILIVLFVAYRSGSLPEIALAGNATANADNVLAKQRDTVPAAFRDSVLKAHREILLMSGSKSAPVIPDDKHPSMVKLVDSLWRNKKFRDSLDNRMERNLRDSMRKKSMIPSTKSGRILKQKNE